MAVYNDTYTNLISQVRALYGSTLTTAEQTRVNDLINMAARRAQQQADYGWERTLVVDEPRTVALGRLQTSEDSFHVYGAGTDAVNGLYVKDGNEYALKDSDGTTLYTLEAFVDAMVVEGAGTAAANGVYLRDGSANSKPRYTLIGGSTGVDSIVWSGLKWEINPSLALYESNADVATPDLVATWAVDAGDAPAPTVRRATLSDSGITAGVVTWRIVDTDDNIVYSNATTSLTPPLTGWVLGSGATPAPKLVDVADMQTALYWRTFSNGTRQSRTFEFQADANGLRPYGNRDDNGIIYVTYIKRMTDVYGDGTGGTTASIPGEWFDYMALYAAYMLQASNRQANGSPAYTLALSEVNRALEDQLMRLESQGLPNTIRQNVETRIAYSNIL